MPAEYHTGLSLWDYLVVAAYGLGVIAVGALYSRRQTNLSEYFLGGRKLNPIVVGISTMATLVSTISYLTTPGEIIKNGFGVLWAMVSIVPAYFVVGYIIIPRIMQHRVVSGYQLLEARFGLGIRQAAACLFVLIRIAWVGLVVYTCSVALSAMTGWPLEYLLVGVGLVTTLYTVLGGIRAVVITDVVQAVILFLGAVAVVAFAAWKAHSLWDWLPDLHNPHVKSGLNWPTVPWVSFSMAVRISVFGMILHQFMWWILTASSDQLAIQRYLSTNDAAAARKSFLVNGIANAVVSLFLVLTGIALLGFFLHPARPAPPVADLLSSRAAVALTDFRAGTGGISELQWKARVLAEGGDKVFPWFIAHVLPAGLSGLLLAALFSAAMSSVSSGINSITTVIMVDFHNAFSMFSHDSAKVRAARWLGVVVGLVTTGVSFLLQYIKGNFMDVAQKINLFFVAPLGALFFMAFFVKRANRYGGWAAVLTGFLVGLGMAYYGELYNWFTGMEIRATFTYTLAASFGASMAAGYLISLLFSRPCLSTKR
ncbi:MAG: sodium/solute symporter [Armatimonadota bacterium]|nr:sodium/solute symporter [Armatimonadota bacterium]